MYASMAFISGELQKAMLAKLAAEENAQVDTLANWLLQAGGLGPPQTDGAQR